MKKNILLLLFMVGIIVGYAQQNNNNTAEEQKDERPDKQTVLKMKVDYLKKNLTLSPEESMQFWTLYNNYVQSEYYIHERYHQMRKKQGLAERFSDIDYKKISDEQIIFLYDCRIKMKQELLELEETFYKQIKGILTPYHISEYYRIEKAFKNECMKQKSCNKGVEKFIGIGDQKAKAVPNKGLIKSK